MTKNIILTENAIKNIKNLKIEYDAINSGLRFGLSGGGCSGYKYILEFEEQSKENDIIFEFDDISVFINSEHINKLNNSVIGWKDTLMESGFDIKNPQAKRPCGCGESIDFND